MYDGHGDSRVSQDGGQFTGTPANRLKESQPSTGADPGFFSGGGAPLRNDKTDSEVKEF